MGKHSKIYGKVVGKDASDRPGWKGPSFTKKKATPPTPTPPKASKPSLEEEKESAIPLELQQLLLNVFKDTFPDVLGSDDRQQLLQEVKNALYERDFKRAFGSERFLETYAMRWSPSRAVCYLGVLVDVSGFLSGIWELCGVLGGGEVDGRDERMRVVAFGGGAAEVVAFGGFVRYFFVNASSEDNVGVEPNPISMTGTQETSTSSGLDLVLVDSAEWGEVVHKLTHSITTPPPLSKYANAAAKAANASLLRSKDIKTTFLAEDVLKMTTSQMSDLFGKSPVLLTLLFTLNELYTSSISSTTKFLLNLTMAAKRGSLLLVVDSPGSYSETTVGESTKKYPMHWLLDHTLLDTSKVDDKAVWEKLVSDDSRWFRMPEELRYPISLENMRYQIHLYRRV
ncbi:uncharacterized protein LY89DRAFT_583157 [Mollisia scopiformis]|uniref:25S rRNA (Uridine(2843)-N(3))-methyltransferase n=1 Tax=Mollisia scopiformis TaxID=149040 RepID=A0A194XDA9_MOLSC|nr:uncharacterized protein LY89DRAFT_583157 [Mollisia scopiformis]KUJ18136.1 hypothetical protein LY89DRAFT_583157 [Mollisia scopiformis]